MVGAMNSFLASLDVVQIMMAAMGVSAVLVTALEGVLIARRRGPEAYDWRAFWTTVRINGWRVVVEAIPMGAVLGAALPFGAWMYAHRLWTVPMDTAWGWVAMFFTTEFFYYWLHRAGHRIRWYWASHQVHHTGNEYNLAAAFRQSITGKVSGGFVFFAPQCLLGFSPDAVLLSYGVNLVYQFWIHTEVVGRLGPLEWVLNTPSHHRVHHGSNARYLDRNYGGVLIVWDRMFGSFQAEIRRPTYGLTKPMLSTNIWELQTHEYAAIARDVRAAGTWRERLGYVFGPPGWTPSAPTSTGAATPVEA